MLRLIRRPLIRDCLALLCLPLVLLLINSNWIFTSVPKFRPATRLSLHLPDAWFYQSYFHHFFDYAPNYPATVRYFIERLPWNLTGYSVYHLLPPLAANYILHLAVYYLAVFSLYGLLNRLFNRRTALISALLFGAYPWLLRAAGWDYVDGFAVAQALLTLYLLVSAAQTTSRRWAILLVIAGMLAVSVIVSNLFWLGLIPSIAAAYLMTNQKSARHNLFVSAVWCAVGALTMTAALAVFNYSVSGNLNFLANSIGFARLLAQNPQDKINVATFWSLTQPLWNVLPILLALASIGTLLRGRKTDGGQHWPLLMCISVFVLGYGFLAFWHLYSAPYLRNYMYFSYLLPHIFLLLGALLAPRLTAVSERRFDSLVGFTFIASVGPLLLMTLFPELLVLQQNFGLLAVASGLVLTALLFMRVPIMAVACFVLAVSAIGFLSDDRAQIDQVFITDRGLGQDNFLAVMDAIKTIDAVFSPRGDYSSFRLWYGSEEPLDVYFAISSVYFYPWGSTLLPFRSNADLTLRSYGDYHDQDKLVVLSPRNQSAVQQSIDRALSAISGSGTITSVTPIVRGDVTFNLYFVTIHFQPSILHMSYGQLFQFDIPLRAANWYTPQTISNESISWAGPGTKSSLLVTLPASRTLVQVQFCIRSAVEPDLADQLELSINEISVPLKSTATSDCPDIYFGRVPPDLLTNSSNAVTLTFKANHALILHDVYGISDYRRASLAYDWLRFMQTP